MDLPYLTILRQYPSRPCTAVYYAKVCTVCVDVGLGEVMVLCAEYGATYLDLNFLKFGEPLVRYIRAFQNFSHLPP